MAAGWVVAAEFGGGGGCGPGVVAQTGGGGADSGWWPGVARRWDFSHCGIGGYFRQCGIASNVGRWRE